MTTFIVEPDPTAASTMQAAIGRSPVLLQNLDQLRRYIEEQAEVDVVVVGPSIDKELALDFADSQRVSRPALGVVLVRRRLESAVLKDSIRAGVREVVSDRDLEGLAEAVSYATELATALRHSSGEPARAAHDSRHGTLVTVFAAKGGCGKTTFATNLAVALADGGRRQVCLVDLDLSFGDVAITLQLFPVHTIADAAQLGSAVDAQAVRALLTPHSSGVQALVAPVEPGIAESVPSSTVSDVIKVLREEFQYVVVDSPPAFTDHVLAAFDESDVVALLATLDIPALKNLKLTLETLELLNYPREKWRIVLNRADSKVGLSMSEVEKTLRMPISAQIPSSRAVPASVNRGVPIVLDEPNHPVSMAIKAFAEQHVLTAGEVSKAGAIPTALRSDRRGLLRRKAKQP